MVRAGMKQNNMSLVLGVTGGIGSGKSTVSQILRQMGAVIIDADTISKEVVMPGEKALEELTHVFGGDILDEYGKLQRKKLADIVFSDRKRLDILNGIVHKYVAQRIKDNVKEQLIRKEKVIVVDAPIPVKEGFIDVCDKIWTIAADKELRIKRIMARNSMTYDEAVARINSQLDEQEYIKIADTVIDNNYDQAHLEDKIKFHLTRLLG